MRGHGTRLLITSFLLLAGDATRMPLFKPTVYRGFRKLLGLPVGVEGVEIDPETMYRPNELAARLGVDGRRVRRLLRDAYPREPEERGKDWYLTPDRAQSVIDHFSAESDQGAPALSDQGAPALWTPRPANRTLSAAQIEMASLSSGRVGCRLRRLHRVM